MLGSSSGGRGLGFPSVKLMVCAKDLILAAEFLIFAIALGEVVGRWLAISGNKSDIACDNSCIFCDHAGLAAVGSEGGAAVRDASEELSTKPHETNRRVQAKVFFMATFYQISL